MKNVLLIISFSFLVFSSQAKRYKVTSLADDGTAGTLRNVIEVIKSNEPFGEDTIFFTLEGIIRLKSPIVIDFNVTIEGLGVDKTTIDGTSAGGSCFKFENGFASQFKPVGNRPLSSFGTEVENLTIQNGDSPDNGGACVVNTYGVSFSNVAFKFNKAKNKGGAIFIEDNAELTLKDCVFENNSALGDGGAISVGTFSYFNLNVSSFILNTSASNGGAIYMGVNSQAYTTCDSLIFIKNEAMEGGAVYLDTSAQFSLNVAVFDGNRALAGFGGAININDAYVYGIYRVTFMNNFAEKGGGAVSLYTTQGSTSFEHSTFSNNTTNGNGGAVFVEGNCDLRNCTITKNKAALGGGIYASFDYMYISGNAIAANTSTSNFPLSNDFVIDNATASVYSEGSNFIGVIDGVIFPAEGGGPDIIGTKTSPLDPKLLPLADNRGFALTHEPAPGSPLLDVVPTGGQTGDFYDQRGEPYVRFFGKMGDIGAVEYQCDYIVDRTDDANECGTLRHSIDFANNTAGRDVIKFKLPANSTIELKSAITISDTLVLEGISTDPTTGSQLANKIGIKSSGTVQNGLIFNGQSGTSTIANFNFQGFTGSAIYLSGVSGVEIISNSFGSTLADETAKGTGNGNAILIEKGTGNKIGKAEMTDFPFSTFDNYFIGNKIGVNNATTTTNTSITENIFSCNTTAGIVSGYKVPVIDTIYESYISGSAKAGDVVQVYADTTCGKNQGEFYGSYLVDATGRWSAYENFNPNHTYTAIATSSSGFSSAFSLPVTVTPCPSLTVGFSSLSVCGDSLSIPLLLKLPLGYNLSAFTDEGSITYVDYDSNTDTLVIKNLKWDTTAINFNIYNDYCLIYESVDVYRFEIPSKSEILPFATTLCTDTKTINAKSPLVGAGKWTSSNSAITFAKATDTTTQVTVSKVPDGGYIVWTVSNGSCPVEKDSVMINRQISVTPDITLTQLNTPICSFDTIYFEAAKNLVNGTEDVVEWFVNEQPVLSGNSLLYDSKFLKNGDVVKVVYSSSINACLTKESDTAEVVMTILQQKVVAVDDVFEVTTGQPAFLDLVLNDDVQNESISALEALSPQAVVSGTSSVEYTSFGKGIETFEYVVTGSCGSVDTATVSVNVINTPPQGIDKELFVLSGGSTSITMQELFTDLEGNLDVFSGTIVSQTNTLVTYGFMSEQVTFDYSAIPAYFGVDTVVIQVTDGAGDVGSVTVIISVQDKLTSNAGPDQSIDAFSTTMAATAVSGYTTSWKSLTAGITFADPTSATTNASGFDPAKSPYKLVWTVSNGTSTVTDTVVVKVKNVAPVVKPLVTVNIQITENTKTLYVEDLVVDQNNNLIGSIEIVKQFSFLPSSVIKVDLQALTITVDLSNSNLDASQGIEDSLLYRICDTFGDCSESYIKIVRKGSFETVKNLELSVGNVYNFMSPTGDNINESFFFNINFGDVKWRFVDESSADGTLRRGDAFAQIFSTILESAEVKIFNRWGDIVAEYDDYMGGKAYRSSGEAATGTEIEDKYVWRGKDKKGSFVTPGTYYYYIILHQVGGGEVKENGFIEVRN